MAARTGVMEGFANQAGAATGALLKANRWVKGLSAEA